jgi:hypothetical protein
MKKVAYFKIGRYYRHSGGGCMHIIGAVKTTLYNWVLVAEDGAARLKPVGFEDEGYTQNWYETTEKDWLTEFNKSNKEGNYPTL